MVTFDFTGLLVVAAVAFVAPLLAGLVPGRLLPAVVLEVLLGLAVGPQGLGWVKPQGAVELLYFMGLGFLLFLAGQDIDPKQFSDPMVRVTSTAYVISLALAFPVALGLTSLATGSADLRLVALCLTSSSLGIVVPVVRDAGAINSDFAQLAVMAATVGEFASLLLLTVLFSADAKSTPEQSSMWESWALPRRSRDLASMPSGVREGWRASSTPRTTRRLNSASAVPLSSC